MRAPATTLRNARRLRRALTAPEARLWKHLRRRDAGLPAFRRQHPIGPYVLDFYCAVARFAIEIDGQAHNAVDRLAKDERRDAWLREQGITVLRIPAGELMRRFDDCMDAIVRKAVELSERRPLHRPSGGPPPPLRGGG